MSLSFLISDIMISIRYLEPLLVLRYSYYIFTYRKYLNYKRNHSSFTAFLNDVDDIENRVSENKQRVRSWRRGHIALCMSLFIFSFYDG